MLACKRSITMIYKRGGQESDCEVGYTGKLCSTCAGLVNGTMYARTGPGECKEC